VGVLSRIVPLVDEPEEDGERLVEVRSFAGMRGAERDEGELAKAVEAVPTFVLGGARRQDAELRRSFGVQQEEDAVQEAQCLLGQRLRLACRQWAQFLGLSSLHDLVRDDLDREADALAKILAHPDGVLDGLLERGRPPDVTLGVRGERLGRQTGERSVDLPALAVVAALEDELEID
jgi:hypothetical protein